MGFFDYFVRSCVTQIQLRFWNFWHVMAVEGTKLTKFRERLEKWNVSSVSNSASKMEGRANLPYPSKLGLRLFQNTSECLKMLKNA